MNPFERSPFCSPASEKKGKSAQGAKEGSCDDLHSPLSLCPSAPWPLEFGYIVLLLAFLSIPLSSFSQARIQGAGSEQKATDPRVVQLLDRASTHHDLATLYIKRGEADLAAAEARKILQLHIPAEHESLVVMSLVIISDKLGEIRRFDMAQGLLDETLKTTGQNTNRAKIFKAKARLYLFAGDDDKAIDSYRRALDLQGK